MFPLFHIFIPILVFEFVIYSNWIKSLNIQRFWIILGSLIPDLLDKPLALISPLHFSGRGHFHSPILWIFLMILASVCKIKKEFVIGFFFGIFSHLLLDIPDIPWFWPFKPLIYYGTEPSQFLTTLLTNRLVQITEIISLIGLITIAVLHNMVISPKFIHTKNIQNYLFSQPKTILSLRKENKINKRATNMYVSSIEMGNNKK